DALTRQPITDDFNLYSGTVNWDLGAVKLTGIVSYQDRYLASGSDVTKYIQTLRTAASCARIYNSGATCGSSTLSNYYAFVDNQIPSALDPQQNMKTISSELRLSSNRSGPLNWTVGGFFSRRKIDVANPQVHAAADGTLQPDATLITVRYINDRLKQIAAFGEVSWDITRRLNLTGGMRYFRYDRTITGQTPIGNVLVGSSVLPLTTVASSEDGEIFKGNASYKITRNIMVYAEAAQGFRPGGINQTIGLDPSLAPYRSDSLWNYEVGVKSTLFDRLLTLNADVYQIDWSNMQITGRTTNGAFSFITNAGAARVRGIEAEATLRPMRGLILQGNGTYTDAVLTTNQSTTAVTAAGLKGDRIPYVPKFTGGVSAEYNWAMSSRIAGMARIDLRHASGSYSDFRPTGTYTRFMKGYELVNLRVGGTLDDGRLGVYLFVNNLFDTTAILRATSSAILVGRTAVTSAQPRTIGLNLQTKF
ncbi:MAG TPA: TonB-dependent receptor, partial [Novosphingobium sp.]|nr:TonB-dependent receptor [Novosphingobium sp.]